MNYRKANWSLAPEWAEYYAVDNDGTAGFYEKKPKKNHKEKSFYPQENSLFVSIENDELEEWEKTLEERPK